MSGFNISPNILDLNPLEQSQYQQHDLGAKAELVDGRVFRYAKAGSSGITAGKLQLAPARKTNHDNVPAASAASKGDTEITVTLGATAATANEYAEGFLIASDVAPEGIALKIASHPAADASASLTLTLADPLPEAVTTSSEFCLVHNAYNAVVEGTVQAGGLVAGVPLVDITASYYGWLQTRGPAPVLADEDGTVNRAVTVGSSTSGAVEERDDLLQATDASRFLLEPTVGYQIVAMVDGEYRPVFLTID